MRKSAKAIFYALINIPFGMLQGPATAILPALYVQHAGLNMTLIGVLITLLRFGDAIMDPVIGYLSDKTDWSFGRRRSWIAMGSIISIPAVLYAFQPGPGTGYVYFTIAYLALTVGWSMAEIPHTAWLGEISQSYIGRNRLSTYRYIAGVLGVILFSMISFLPFLPDRSVTPLVLQVAAVLATIMIAIFVPISLLAIAEIPQLHQVKLDISLQCMLKDLLKNRILVAFLIAQGIGGMASGMVSGLYFMYIGTYLSIGDDYTLVMLIVYSLSIVGSLLWSYIGRFCDKNFVIAMCSLFVAASNVAMYFIARGPDAFQELTAVLAVSAFCTSGATAAQISLLADIADYGRWKSKRQGNGNYFAALSFVNKASLALGAGLGLMIAGAAGFRPDHANDQFAMTGFFISIIWIPFALNLIAAVISFHLPLSRRRHAVIVKAIYKRRLSGDINEA